MIKSIKKSLTDLLGGNYMDAVVYGAEALLGMPREKALEYACEEVDFYPKEFAGRVQALTSQIGKNFAPSMIDTNKGAATAAFEKASKLQASPVCAMGFLRLGEDGRLYLVSKSEHYHTPLGHAFPGYKLISNAKALGITNATHNNTRGYITRLLEQELVRTSNGLEKSDKAGLEAVLRSKEPHVLNRVLNLETGSLACEAGIKMMLSRFYKIHKTHDEPKYCGKTPVFFVIADNEDKSTANYHGTTIFTQTFRGMWPDFYAGMDEKELYRVCAVRINDFSDFERKFAKYNQGNYRPAGFIHEIIMMNYGGIRLDKEYLQKVYELCHKNDTPVMADEIQSCMWYKPIFLFREYGLNPDFAVIGKGFSGGEYPASRILTTYEMDNLSQFDALVTNGQEELASLSYIITMEFVQANGEHIEDISKYYTEKLHKLKEKYPDTVEKIEGLGHLASICFNNVVAAVKFMETMGKTAIDVSAQTYKPKCPPAVLTKIPVISTREMVDYLTDNMDEALKGFRDGGK